MSLFFSIFGFCFFFVVKRNFHAPRSETVSWAQSRLRGQKQRRVAHIVVVFVTAVLVAYIVVAAANIHIYVAAVLVVVADLLICCLSQTHFLPRSVPYSSLSPQSLGQHCLHCLLQFTLLLQLLQVMHILCVPPNSFAEHTVARTVVPPPPLS